MTDDKDLIRRGDAERIVLAYANPESAEKAHNAIRALAAARVGVKPLVWKPLDTKYASHMAHDPLFGQVALTLDPAGYDAERAARILDALAPQPVTDALALPEVRALVEAAKEVGRISDRDHVAWQRLSAALAPFKDKGGV